jgi:hypothetical protein
MKRLLATVMGGGGPKLPLSVDFTALADGALPGKWVGAAFAISGAKAVNTPTLSGVELITNPGFEGTYASGIAPNWTKYPAGAVASESADVHEGTAAQYIGNGTGAVGQISSKVFALSLGDWVRCSGWSKLTGAGYLMLQQGFGGYTTFNQITISGDGSAYVQRFTSEYVPATGNHGFNERVNTNATAETNNAILDTFSVQKLTLSTITAYYNEAYSGATRAGVSMRVGIAGQPAGVIGWWDKANMFQNCLVARHDGVNAILFKVVGTTYSSLINLPAAYADDADLEIRRLTGTNTFQLWYNGSQVGANQTIADPEIINNKYFGILSTGGSNSFDAFFRQ